MCKYLKKETDLAQNLINDFFFWLWISEDLSTGRILSEKLWGSGLISEKTEAFYVELNKRAEAATSSYSATGNLLNTFILCLWIRTIRRSDLGM